MYVEIHLNKRRSPWDLEAMYFSKKHFFRIIYGLRDICLARSRRDTLYIQAVAKT